MNVLAFDTAGPVLGVALWCNGRVYERADRVTRGAEGLLLPWAEALCAEAGIELSALDGVAVAHGPGAFTGLRVGLATAAGLAMSLDVPVWGGSSLESRACAATLDDANALPVLALLDARKGKVYAALYTAEGDELHAAEDVLPEVALGWSEGPFVAVGEGAVVYAEDVLAAGGVVAEEAAAPCTGYLARLGEAAFSRGEGMSPELLTPTYLREADAKPSTKGRILGGT